MAEVCDTLTGLLPLGVDVLSFFGKGGGHRRQSDRDEMVMLRLWQKSVDQTGAAPDRRSILNEMCQPCT